MSVNDELDAAIDAGARLPAPKSEEDVLSRCLTIMLKEHGPQKLDLRESNRTTLCVCMEANSSEVHLWVRELHGDMNPFEGAIVIRADPSVGVGDVIDQVGDFNGGWEEFERLVRQLFDKDQLAIKDRETMERFITHTKAQWEKPTDAT